jgi:hypothetical protein
MEVEVRRLTMFRVFILWKYVRSVMCEVEMRNPPTIASMPLMGSIVYVM